MGPGFHRDDGYADSMTEHIVSILFAGILGAVIGSFANVLILRWHEEVSILGRSHCPACNQQIRWVHLVPILSWILLRGKCAACDSAISIQYPLVEATAMVLAIIAAVRHDPLVDPLLFTFEFLSTVGLIVPVVMDLRWKELPLEYLIGLSAFVLLFRLLVVDGGGPVSVIAYDIASIAVVSGFFALQVIISRERWLGSGDIWFGLLMACILGWPGAFVGVYAAYLLGGIVAALGLLSGLLKRGDRVAFAPVLAAGTLFALWYGAPAIHYFFH
jgi:leader peptidase (prepilin peptidase)/N-methyltransferase